MFKKSIFLLLAVSFFYNQQASDISGAVSVKDSKDSKWLVRIVENLLAWSPDTTFKEYNSKEAALAEFVKRRDEGIDYVSLLERVGDTWKERKVYSSHEGFIDFEK